MESSITGAHAARKYSPREAYGLDTIGSPAPALKNERPAASAISETAASESSLDSSHKTPSGVNTLKDSNSCRLPKSDICCSIVACATVSRLGYAHAFRLDRVKPAATRCVLTSSRSPTVVMTVSSARR